MCEPVLFRSFFLESKLFGESFTVTKAKPPLHYESFVTF